MKTEPVVVERGGGDAVRSMDDEGQKMLRGRSTVRHPTAMVQPLAVRPIASSDPMGAQHNLLQIDNGRSLKF
jgi:hypothetical protein